MRKRPDCHTTGGCVTKLSVPSSEGPLSPRPFRPPPRMTRAGAHASCTASTIRHKTCDCRPRGPPVLVACGYRTCCRKRLLIGNFQAAGLHGTPRIVISGVNMMGQSLPFHAQVGRRQPNRYQPSLLAMRTQSGCLPALFGAFSGGKPVSSRPTPYCSLLSRSEIGSGTLLPVDIGHPISLSAACGMSLGAHRRAELIAPLIVGIPTYRRFDADRGASRIT